MFPALNFCKYVPQALMKLICADAEGCGLPIDVSVGCFEVDDAGITDLLLSGNRGLKIRDDPKQVSSRISRNDSYL